MEKIKNIQFECFVNATKHKKLGHFLPSVSPSKVFLSSQQIDFKNRVIIANVKHENSRGFSDYLVVKFAHQRGFTYFIQVIDVGTNLCTISLPVFHQETANLKSCVKQIREWEIFYGLCKFSHKSTLKYLLNHPLFEIMLLDQIGEFIGIPANYINRKKLFSNKLLLN